MCFHSTNQNTQYSLDLLISIRYLYQNLFKLSNGPHQCWARICKFHTKCKSSVYITRTILLANKGLSHDMMTSSNGNIFRVTGHLCGEFTGHRSQRPVTRSFDVFFDLRLNKRLRQPWGWWFETPSRSLWRHCNELHCPPVKFRLTDFPGKYSHTGNGFVLSRIKLILQWIAFLNKY